MSSPSCSSPAASYAFEWRPNLCPTATFPDRASGHARFCISELAAQGHIQAGPCLLSLHPLINCIEHLLRLLEMTCITLSRCLLQNTCYLEPLTLGGYFFIWLCFWLRLLHNGCLPM